MAGDGGPSVSVLIVRCSQRIDLGREGQTNVLEFQGIGFRSRAGTNKDNKWLVAHIKAYDIQTGRISSFR
jgi:hypothetical protein